jgi:hypothetical protein
MDSTFLGDLPTTFATAGCVFTVHNKPPTDDETDVLQL